MKKKWLFMFMVDLYVFQCFLFFAYVLPHPVGPDYHRPLITFLFISFIVLSLFLIIINIVCAIRMQKVVFLTDAKSNSLRAVMGFKIGLIPFYVVNFVLWLIATGICLNPLMFLFGIFVAIIGAIVTYLTLLTTSSYGISQIIILGRKNVLTKKQCVAHIVLQLIFIADVADSIFLFVKYGKSN